MKRIRKLLWVAAAFAAVLALAACEQESGTSVVAEYGAEKTAQNISYVYNLTFMSDGTWTGETYVKSVDKQLAVSKAEGTYTGDPAKDGKVEIASTKILAVSEADNWNVFNPDKWGEITLVEQDLSKLPDEQKKATLTISGGGKTASTGEGKGATTLTRK